jgi:hypothetical protein
MVNSILSVRQRTRAQTAAFLLGIHPELPNTDEGVANSRVHAVQHFYEGIDSEESSTIKRCHAAPLEKSE